MGLTTTIASTPGAEFEIPRSYDVVEEDEEDGEVFALEESLNAGLETARNIVPVRANLSSVCKFATQFLQFHFPHL